MRAIPSARTRRPSRCPANPGASAPLAMPCPAMDHGAVTGAGTLRAAVESLARDLEHGALEMAGAETWPKRLRDAQAGLASATAIDLDDLAETIFGATEAMNTLGLTAGSHNLAWSIVNVMIIREYQREHDHR